MSVLEQLSQGMAELVAEAGRYVVRVEARRRLPASGIVWSTDGIIVTAHHVVEEMESIGLGLADGRSVSATLLGRDPSSDVAVLRAEAAGLAVPEWAQAEGARVGHLIMALGRPGYAVQATHGVVSALSADWRTPAGGRSLPCTTTSKRSQGPSPASASSPTRSTKRKRCGMAKYSWSSR